MRVYDEFTDTGRRRVFQFFRDGKEHVAVMTERPLLGRGSNWTQIALEFEGEIGRSDGIRATSDFEFHASVVADACRGITTRYTAILGYVSEAFAKTAARVAGAQLPVESL